MRLQDFIKKNRAQIDKAINAELYRYDGEGKARKTIPEPADPATTAPHDDNFRAQWIMGDEGLFNWARREGVKI